MKTYNSGFYFEVEIVSWKSIIPTHHLTPAWKKKFACFYEIVGRCCLIGWADVLKGKSCHHHLLVVQHQFSLWEKYTNVSSGKMVQDITKSGPAVKIGATHVGGDNGSSWSQLARWKWSTGLWCSGHRFNCSHSTLIAANPSTSGGKLKRQIAKLDRQQLQIWIAQFQM